MLLQIDYIISNNLCLIQTLPSFPQLLSLILIASVSALISFIKDTESTLKYKQQQIRACVYPSYLFLKYLKQRNTLDNKIYPTNIYLFKVSNKNTRKRCEICSKLTIKTPERRHWQIFF